MTAMIGTGLYDVTDVSVDLPISGGLLWGLLPGRQRRLNILSGITLSVKPGETLGLVGESGSGKSTLARAMQGLTAISAGTLRFAGQDLNSKAAMTGLRRTSAMMFQDSVASLSPRMKIGALLTEPFVIHGIKMADRKAKAVELLAQVGLPASLAARYPHELSGGQARRVCVARALALNPQLVIADEPTAGLDVSVQSEILNLMTELKSRLGLSFMVITHNLAMVRHVSDQIAILYLGRLVETGPTRAVFGRPLHPYTKSLIASEPQPDPRKRRADLAIKGEIPSILRRPRGCEFHTRCAMAQELCRTAAPELRELSPGRHVRCHFAENT